MGFDYAAMKAALKDAGHPMSEGDGITALDTRELEIHARLKHGMSFTDAAYGLAYPSLLPEGFPGFTADAPETVTPQVAKVASVQAASKVADAPVKAADASVAPSTDKLKAALAKPAEQPAVAPTPAPVTPVVAAPTPAPVVADKAPEVIAPVVAAPVADKAPEVKADVAPVTPEVKTETKPVADVAAVAEKK